MTFEAPADDAAQHSIAGTITEKTIRLKTHPGNSIMYLLTGWIRQASLLAGRSFSQMPPDAPPSFENSFFSLTDSSMVYTARLKNLTKRRQRLGP